VKHHTQRWILCSTTTFSTGVSTGFSAESKMALQQNRYIVEQRNYKNIQKCILQQQNNFTKSFPATIN